MKKVGLATWLLAAHLMAQTSPQELLQQSQTYFDQGNYTKALALLAPLNIRQDFDSSEDMIAAFKIRAVAYAQIGEQERTKEIIKELLFIDPHYKFDPFDTPKSVVDLAEAEAQEIFVKNQRIINAKSQNAQLKSPPDFSYKPSFSTVFLPFGLHYYYTGSPTKGSVHLALQTIGLVGNIGAFWWKQSYLEKFGVSRLRAPEDKSRFYAAQITQYVALSMLIGSLGVSIIDGIISLQEGKR